MLYYSLTVNFLFRFILHAKKTGFVVEHDFIMATYLADRVVVFDGIPSVSTNARRYNAFIRGFCYFLRRKL